MNIGILGTGMVGKALGSKLVELGHSVLMGSRKAEHPGAADWAAGAGANASRGTFAAAAQHGEIVINCTAGAHSIAALQAAGAENLAGKLLLDISNPLDFSQGMPPRLSIVNDDSLGELIQRTFPETKVVKTLNTVSAAVMVEPSRLPGNHAIFMHGNDAGAKAQTREILQDWFGWREVVDVGDITTARGTEMYLPLWVRLWQVLGTTDFNIQIVKKGDES